MFNVTVIKLKDLIRYIIRVIIIFFIIYFIYRIIFEKNIIKKFFSKTINIDNENIGYVGIDNESAIIKNISKNKSNNIEQKEKRNKIMSIKSILQIEASAFRVEKDENNLEQENEEIKNEEIVKNDQIENQEKEQGDELITDVENIEIKVVTEKPIPENYNREYKGIKIKNESSFDLTDTMLNSENLDINKKNILIFHTHTCESYTESEKYKYISSRKL